MDQEFVRKTYETTKDPRVKQVSASLAGERRVIEILRADGRLLLQQDRWPANGLLPTGQWRQGERPSPGTKPCDKTPAAGPLNASSWAAL